MRARITASRSSSCVIGKIVCRVRKAVVAWPS
jgi:hypothetical protein